MRIAAALAGRTESVVIACGRNLCARRHNKRRLFKSLALTCAHAELKLLRQASACVSPWPMLFGKLEWCSAPNRQESGLLNADQRPPSLILLAADI